MNIMLEFPFARVDGVELAESTAEVARSNFRKLRVPADRWRIFTADAAEFSALDDYNYVYFYNPFASEVMEMFIAQLAASVRRTPRVVTLIYDHPVCHQAIVASGAFRQLPSNYRDETGNPISLYESV